MLTNTTRQLLILVVCCMLDTLGCRSLEQKNRSAMSTTLAPQSHLEAEDLAILLPIRTWQRPADDLAKDLIPLRKIFSDAVYKKLLAEIVDYPGDGPHSPNPFHPQTDPKLALIRDGIPLDEWYITGIRLIPCSRSRWNVPDSWLVLLDKDLTLCLPTIRLSAQRFAMVTGSLDKSPQLTSDDKALHFNFVFLGKPERAAKIAAFLQFDHEVAAAVIKRQAESISADEQKLLASSEASSRPRFDFDLVKNLVRDRQADHGIEAAAWNTLIRETKAEFIQLLHTIKGKEKTGSLRLRKYEELPVRQERILALIPDIINQQTLPLTITFNFAHTGVRPGFSQGWTLGAFTLQSSQPLSLLQTEPSALKPQRLVATADVSLNKSATGETFTVYRQLDRGYQESFFNKMGSLVAIDPELLEAINQARMLGNRAVAPVVRDLLRLTGNITFAQAGGADQGSRAIDQTSVMTALGAEAESSYHTILNPAIDLPHTSCLSCHIASSFRLSFRMNPQEQFVADRDNFSKELRGPAGTGQVDFTDQWLVRSLGYLGRIPSISDRVVTEVERDLKLLREP